MTALVFCDGFDKYGPAGNQNLTSVFGGDFSISAGTPTLVAGLSATGYAISFPTSTSISGSLPASLTRVAGSIRFQTVIAGASAAALVRFFNTATAAFSICFSSGGVIELRTGNTTGTVVASGGAVATGTTHVLSFDITIGAAAAYAIYLDGILLLSGTGNTGNGQTSVNVIGSASSTSSTFTLDDLAIFNPADAAYNPSALTNNVVVETSFPSGDAQKQFTNDGNVVWPTGIVENGVYRATTAATQLTFGLYLLKVTPQVNCTLNSVSLIPNVASGSAKFRGVVYSDSSGAPNLLLTSGTEIIGATAGATLTMPLTTPQTLNAGTPVWIGFIDDTSLNLQQFDNITALGQRKANTYASGAPANGSGMTTGQPTYLTWGNCTGAATNVASEMLNPPLGTAQSQVHSSTVAQEDLYTFPALSTTPSAIYGVAVKGFIAKSDSGARTVSLNMKSGSSDSTGSAPGQSMSTTNQWQRTFYDVDPGTGSAWTQSGLNAASSGVSVAS